MFLLSEALAEIVRVLSHLQNILLIQIRYFQRPWGIVFPCQVVLRLKADEKSRMKTTAPLPPPLFTRESKM